MLWSKNTVFNQGTEYTCTVGRVLFFCFRGLWFMFDCRRLKAVLPILAVKSFCLNLRRVCTEIDTRQRDCDTIWIWSRCVPRQNSARFTEATDCSFRAPQVQCCCFDPGCFVHSKLIRGNDKVGVAAHRAIGTRTVPDCQSLSVALDLSRNFSTVAPDRKFSQHRIIVERHVLMLSRVIASMMIPKDDNCYERSARAVFTVSLEFHIE